MQDEIFGPILPVFTYKNIQEVINFINDRDKPLALYYFGENNQHKEKILNETSSGAFCINECIMHYMNHTLPFGGVGNSGYGAIHGKHGFNSCSHLKPVLDKSGYLGTLNAYPLSCRYPPYTEQKMKTMNFLAKIFDVYPSDIFGAVWLKILYVLVLAFVFGCYFKMQ